MILPLGYHWVLDNVCVTLSEWADRPELAELMTIAVNERPTVSQPRLRGSGFLHSGPKPNQSGKAKTRTDRKPSRRERPGNHQRKNARGTENKGISFSLDDFGTGYSSPVPVWKLLPLEQLKIDQSFVRDILVDPNDAAIATTIIALAESLGLQAIAEALGPPNKRRPCSAISGCHGYQGYFFSRPLPVTDFEHHVRSSQPYGPALLKIVDSSPADRTGQ